MRERYKHLCVNDIRVCKMESVAEFLKLVKAAKKSELVERCEEARLPTTGDKATLMARLQGLTLQDPETDEESDDSTKTVRGKGSSNTNADNDVNQASSGSSV